MPDFGFPKSRKIKVIMEVMQMKCRACGKDTAELSGGYCLRCEKIAADVEAELAMGCEQQ